MRRVLLPLLAALVLTGDPSFLVAAVHPQKGISPGTQRWSVKTSAATKKARIVSWEEFVSLQNPPGVTKNDPRYQGKRIPEFPNAPGLKEGDIVSLKCWLHLVALESDGDYHIQVSNDSVDGNNCVVVEIPDPDPGFVHSQTLRPLFSKAREWVRGKLLHDASREPSSTGNVMMHTPRVMVTGQLFFDDAHVGDPPRGKKGMKATTLWEIHPVKAMSFAPR